MDETDKADRTIQNLFPINELGITWTWDWTTGQPIRMPIFNGLSNIFLNRNSITTQQPAQPSINGTPSAPPQLNTSNNGIPSFSQYGHPWLQEEIKKKQDKYKSKSGISWGDYFKYDATTKKYTRETGMIPDYDKLLQDALAGDPIAKGYMSQISKNYRDNQKAWEKAQANLEAFEKKNNYTQEDRTNPSKGGEEYQNLIDVYNNADAALRESEIDYGRWDPENKKSLGALYDAEIANQKNLNLAKYSDMTVGALGAGAVMFGQSGTQDTKGTQTVDQASNIIESAPGAVGVVGKGVNTLGKIANASYNKIDEYQDQSFGTQLAGSNMLGWLGMNRWGSKRFGKFAVDPTLRSKIGASYSGSTKIMDYVANNISGKRIGTFDKGKAQRFWNKADSQYNITSGILTKADDVLARGSEMSDINATRRQLKLNGDYDLAHVYVNKKGGKMKTAQQAIDNFKVTEVPDYVATVDDFQVQEIPDDYSFPEELAADYIVKTVPDDYQFDDELVESFNVKEPPTNWHEDTLRILDQSNANFVQRLKDPNRKVIQNWENESEVNTHKLSYSEIEKDGQIKYVVYPDVQEIDGELHDFTNPLYKHDKWDAYEMAKVNDDYIILDTEEEAKWLLDHYKEYYPVKYAKGGSLNVIPEGALHARKHNMDTDLEITNKGIPVIDNYGNQQAEIELNEVIFRLEVTETIEKLLKKYESKDYSKEEKDQFAIKAGKLLVEELLHNTDDRTNLINQI